MKSFTASCDLLDKAYAKYEKECKSKSPGYIGRKREKDFLLLMDTYKKANKKDYITAFIQLGMFVIKQSSNSRLKRHLIEALFDIFTLPPVPELKPNKKTVKNEMPSYGCGFMYAMAFSSREERNLAIKSEHKANSETYIHEKKEEGVKKAIKELEYTQSIINCDSVLIPDLLKIVAEYSVCSQKMNVPDIGHENNKEECHQSRRFSFSS